jgi:hypothetical protein
MPNDTVNRAAVNPVSMSKPRGPRLRLNRLFAFPLYSDLQLCGSAIPPLDHIWVKPLQTSGYETTIDMGSSIDIDPIGHASTILTQADRNAARRPSPTQHCRNDQCEQPTNSRTD